MKEGEIGPRLLVWRCLGKKRRPWLYTTKQTTIEAKKKPKEMLASAFASVHVEAQTKWATMGSTVRRGKRESYFFVYLPNWLCPTKKRCENCEVYYSITVPLTHYHSV